MIGDGGGGGRGGVVVIVLRVCCVNGCVAIEGANPVGLIVIRGRCDIAITTTTTITTTTSSTATATATAATSIVVIAVMRGLWRVSKAVVSIGTTTHLYRTGRDEGD